MSSWLYIVGLELLPSIDSSAGTLSSLRNDCLFDRRRSGWSESDNGTGVAFPLERTRLRKMLFPLDDLAATASFVSAAVAGFENVRPWSALGPGRICLIDTFLNIILPHFYVDSDGEGEGATGGGTDRIEDELEGAVDGRSDW